MNKLAIVLDNLKPYYENKVLFETLNKIYENDKNSSINLFVKNIDWPYKKVEYGIFKLIDYQNFSGNTIVTNLELLDRVLDIPNNNKINLYLYNIPFLPSISGKKALNLLTNIKNTVYCRVGYIRDLISTFGCDTKICNFEEVIKEKLYV